MADLLTKIIIFIILVILCFYISLVKRRCKSKSKKYYILSKLVALIHAIYFVYYYLGSVLFGYHLIHFLIAFTNLTTWIYFIYKYGIGCPLTYTENILCKPQNEESKQYQDILRHIFSDILHFTPLQRIIAFIILGVFVISYDLYYILYLKI